FFTHVLYLPRVPRDVHSFPTRRSSDLILHVRAQNPVLDEHVLATGIAFVVDVDGASVVRDGAVVDDGAQLRGDALAELARIIRRDRKSTRLNSSHVKISYAVFCSKKKR